jgi:hypothetical protein
MFPEEIYRTLITISPIWDERVRGLFEAGKYDEGAETLSAILENDFTDEDWGAVYWGGIMKGVEAIRGSISSDVWQAKVLPFVGRAIFATATPKRLASIYQTLPAEQLLAFHKIIVAAIPGNDFSQKIKWLKNNDSALLAYFAANLAGFRIDDSRTGLLDPQNNQRYPLLSSSLRTTLVSLSSVELLSRLAKEQGVPEEKVSAAAEVVGLIILGRVKFPDVVKVLGEKTGLPQEKCVSFSKALGDQLLNSLRADIETPVSVASVARPIEAGAGASADKTTASPTFPLPQNSTPVIPRPFAQKPESFFKTDSLTTSGEATQKQGMATTGSAKPSDVLSSTTTTGPVTVGPVIIHQETRAEALPATPKLGFRIGENKLSEAKDRPEALKPIGFSSLSSLATTRPESQAGDVGAIPEGKTMADQKLTVPSKLTIPVAPMGAKLVIPKDILSAPAQGGATESQSPSLLGKIKNIWSKETTPTRETALKSVPLPPPKETSALGNIRSTPIEPTQAKISSIPISVEKEGSATKPTVISPVAPEKKTVPAISPLPSPEKQPPQGASFSLPIPPSPSPKLPTASPVLVVEKKEGAADVPRPAPAISLPKVDLKKVSDISVGTLPPPPSAQLGKPLVAPTKLGIFSRWFKKSEPSKKIFVPPPNEKPASISTAQTPKNVPPPVISPITPLPPPPPVPPRTFNLPKSTSEIKPQPLPIQKISPLSNRQEKSMRPTIPASSNTTVDIISAAPKVINYSEYPATEKPSS